MVESEKNCMPYRSDKHVGGHSIDRTDHANTTAPAMPQFSFWNEVSSKNEHPCESHIASKDFHFNKVELQYHLSACGCHKSTGKIEKPGGVDGIFT